MAYPTAKVFIAFDDGPYVDAPTWTEVTSYTRAISITRGRTQDYADFESGTATITLDNRDQRFSPFNTSSPYVGKLVPRRQIKIEGRANSVDYQVFRGYINGWPVELTDAGFDSTVTIQAFDILGLMTNEQIPGDWNDYVTRSVGPLHYYKMNDATGATRLKDYVGTSDLAPDLTLSSATTVTQIENPAPGIPHTALMTTNSYWTGPDNRSAPGSNQAISISIWAKDDVLGFRAQYYYGNTTLLMGSGGGGSPGVSVNYGTLTTGTTSLWTDGADESNFRHYVGTVTSGGTVKIYVDGIERTFASTGANAIRGTANADIPYGVYGCVAEVSMYNKALTAAEVKQLYDAGFGRIADTTFSRYDRILGQTSIPAGRQEKVGTAVANVLDIGNLTKAGDELRITADSEGGFIYATRDGKLRITGRDYVFDTTIDAEIADTGALGTLKYSPEISWMWDAENLRNDVTIDYTNAGVYQTTNPTTIAAYGAAAVNIETRLAALTDATSLAAFELGTGTPVVPAVSEIDLTPNTADTAWQTILQIELLDRVKVTTTPKTGSAIIQQMLVNQIRHEVVPGRWSTRITPSGRYTSPLILDDAVFGRLDYNYLG
jgi:hypothetical protein